MNLTRELFVDGQRLETLYGAPPAGRPTIVFLHEGLGSISTWRDFPAQLARRAGCGFFVYSRCGHGQSERLAGPRPVDYMHHEAFGVLPQLLHAAAIGRPVLFGHSDGASIALLFAARFPHAAAGLILEAPHLFVEAPALVSIAAARDQFVRSDLGAKLARHHRDAAATFYGWNDIWLDPRFRSWNIESDCAGVLCPVLAIQGKDDEYGTLEQIERLRARVTGMRVLVLERCGHAPHRDQPEAVLSTSADFIEQIA